MSWATNYSGHNNIHHNKPALMSDGRNFAHWDTNNETNRKMKKSVGIENNFHYRQYLMKNADKIINNNFTTFVDNCSDVPTAKAKTFTNKYLFKDLTDTTTPYGYEHSDLKNMYLSRQSLNSKLVGPILTQEEIFMNKTEGQ